ncbi:hypothetical protein Taro_021202 [Colocasia esculenta]|uniref:CBS domain-containing protein n=1 Tax=Colocasia esculenta TaxID=4460 RepID=A0A843V1S5_COLES|nr:hypothetical protein [Colocasia esculenta]
MAVGLLAHEVSDLCIGKPALRSLPPSATVGEALLSLKRCGDSCLAVWSERTPGSAKGAACLGKVCMVDIICYLCSEESLASPASALRSPVSALLPKDSGALISRVERHSSVVEALDVILGGAQSLMVPLRAAGVTGRKKPQKNALAFCWLTQEDFVRFFLNSIAAFSPVPALSVDYLGIVRPDVLAVRYHQPALAAVPLIKQALASQTAVAVITDDGKLIGEISPSTLANCDETVAAAVATLSAGELMAYIDSGGLGGPPEEALRAVKARLMERGMRGMLELVDDAAMSDASLSSPSSGSSSGSSSSDEESAEGGTGGGRRLRRGYNRSGSYSARMGRRSEDAIVCHPWSSLVAVMIQALAHRVSYVWVVEDDYQLAGVVTFPDVLTVFREQLQAFDQQQQQ